MSGLRIGEAVLSECGHYRYRLDRRGLCPTGPVVAFIGVNPSRADAHVDDHTVRKMRGFANLQRCSRFIVGNVFAYRSTEVFVLATVDDPVGIDNDHYLREICNEADIIVACWGNRDKLPPNLHRPVSALSSYLRNTHDAKLRTLGLCKSGDPKHPLMLAYNTELRPW